jgi:hypothetical protein
MDPDRDPGGPKTSGSGFGSITLRLELHHQLCTCGIFDAIITRKFVIENETSKLRYRSTYMTFVGMLNILTMSFKRKVWGAVFKCTATNDYLQAHLYKINVSVQVSDNSQSK